jgi:glutamate synthase (NADPH/NADH)
MSGGIAYVLDTKGIFPTFCNTTMVQLLPLVSVEDAVIVHSLLEEYYEKTASDYAKVLLDEWPKARYKFVKVFPYDYQKALQAQEAEDKKEKKAKGKSPKVNVKTNGFQTKLNDIADIEDAAGPSQPIDKARGFMKYNREVVSYRPAEKRMNDWEEIYDFDHVKKGLKVQASRCMDCGVPFCQSSFGCPLGNIIPKWNDLVSQDKWKEALDQLLQTNNFPEFTGRVCPAPCESACVLGINNLPVTIKSIECSIIDYAFEQGWMKAEPPLIRTGKKVAVVGSGPAGLACAHQLNKVSILILCACSILK